MLREVLSCAVMPVMPVILVRIHTCEGEVLGRGDGDLVIRSFH